MGSANAKRRREVDWKPRLKDRKQRGARVAASASSRAADAAISNLKTIERHQRKGVQVDGQYLEKVAISLDPAAAARLQAQRDADTPRGPRGWMLLLGGAGVAVAVAVAGWGMVGKSSHSVSGSVLLDGQPLGNVRVCFHPVEKDQGPARAKASQTGAFRIDNLPAGSYRVTLEQDSDEGPVTVPNLYGKPETTRLQFKLARDLGNIQFFATTKSPSPKR